MMLKLKGGCKRVALCGNQKVDANGGIMMCKFKRQMEKGGHYDMELKGWMQQGAI